MITQCLDKSQNIISVHNNHSIHATVTLKKQGHIMDFSNMTPKEILALIDAANTEVAARQNRDALQRDINNVLVQAREHGAAHPPKRQWDGTPHIDESFALGETTVLEGVTYESTIPNNQCDPRECRTGWERVEPGDDDA